MYATPHAGILPHDETLRCKVNTLFCVGKIISEKFQQMEKFRE